MIHRSMEWIVDLFLAKCEEVAWTLQVKLLQIVYINDVIIIEVSLEQVTLMEKATNGQARNKLWFYQREGRITASNIKAALRTSHIMPVSKL